MARVTASQQHLLARVRQMEQGVLATREGQVYEAATHGSGPHADVVAAREVSGILAGALQRLDGLLERLERDGILPAVGPGEEGAPLLSEGYDIGSCDRWVGVVETCGFPLALDQTMAQEHGRYPTL